MLIAIAYFGDQRSATRGKNELVRLTKYAAKRFGPPVTDAELRDVIRQKRNVVYNWFRPRSRFATQVEQCLSA